MERQDIAAGIKNAIERGYSLEQAKRSFLNAGYSYIDVEDSAKQFSGVISNIPSPPSLFTATNSPTTPTSQKPILPPIQQKQQTSISSLQMGELPTIQPQQKPQYQAQQPQTQSSVQIQKPKNRKKIFWIIVTIFLIIVLLLLLGFFGMELFAKETLIKWFPFLKKFG